MMLAFYLGVGLGTPTRKLVGTPQAGQTLPRPRCAATSPKWRWNRRQLLSAACATSASLATANLPLSANASEKQRWWPPECMKKSFAEGMAGGMGDYELAVSKRKRNLFANIPPHSRILDVGIGAGPNLPYLPQDCDVVGLDPNPYMFPYADKKAAGLVSRGIRLKVVQGEAEAIPFEDESFDVVLCTLTLCSVNDVERAVKEMQRVLVSGGLFIFVEHVHAEGGLLSAAQTLLTPLQVLLADGCHLNRDSGSLVRKYGTEFRVCEVERFDVELGVEGKLISSQISGRAIKR